jgi:sulfide:quinone oxidoreductase
VDGFDNVYAAGDLTNFPIKQGGLAAQQAEAAASAIAASAGADVDPQGFRPVLRGMLLNGAEPMFMRTELEPGHGDTSSVATEALWWPPGKIAGRHLAPYLAELAGSDLQPPAPSYGVAIEVDLERGDEAD